MRMLKMMCVFLLAVCLLGTLCACDAGGKNPNPDSSVTDDSSVDDSSVPAGDESSQPVDDGKVTYTVTVKDADGNPVSGAMVQICKETCFPTMTDANGVATWSMEEDEYKISFAMTPAGFAVEEAYYFEDDATEMTITLQVAE